MMVKINHESHYLRYIDDCRREFRRLSAIDSDWMPNGETTHRIKHAKILEKLSELENIFTLNLLEIYNKYLSSQKLRLKLFLGEIAKSQTISRKKGAYISRIDKCRL